MAILQRTLAATAAAAALAGALTLPAWAQSAPAASHPTTSASAPAKHPGHQRLEPAALHAKHMDRIKPLLQLTAAQEGAWKQFVDATAPQKRPSVRMDREAREKLTTPERIEKAQALRKQRNQSIEQRESATLAFYATLSPAQQKAFDAAQPRMRAEGPRHHGFKKHGAGHDKERSAPHHRHAPHSAPAPTGA